MSLHAQSVTARQYSAHVEALNRKIGDVRTTIGNINRDLQSFSDNLDAPHNLSSQMGQLRTEISNINEVLEMVEVVKQIEPAVSALEKVLGEIDKVVKTAKDKLDDVDINFIKPVKTKADNVLKVTQDHPDKILRNAEQVLSNSVELAEGFEACLNDLPEGGVKSNMLRPFSKGLSEADRVVVGLDTTVSSIQERLDPLEQAVDNTRTSIGRIITLIGQVKVNELEDPLIVLDGPLGKVKHALNHKIVSYAVPYVKKIPDKFSKADFRGYKYLTLTRPMPNTDCKGLEFWDPYGYPLVPKDKSKDKPGSGSCWYCGHPPLGNCAIAGGGC